MWFSNIEEFEYALDVFYLHENIKRCWALISGRDKIVVIQPNVSTPGLNILLLKTINIDAEKIKELLDLFKKEGIEVIEADYIRRPSKAKGFTLGFKKPSGFLKALKIFYLSKKTVRCWAITPQKGSLIIQPDRSTPELNILVLEDFDSVVGKQKEKIKTKINSLRTIKCDAAESSHETVNF